MNAPKVSLFLTTYNWTEALSLCLQSIAAQSHLPDEVIVADDGSGEATKAIINQFKADFPCPLIHVWQEDKGYRINAIRNKAIALASHPYIIQIDGDIICDRHFVKDHLSFAKANRLVIGRRTDISALATDQFCQELKYDHLSSFRSKAVAIMHQYLLYDDKKVKGVRGCNMAYWRDDAYKVNGYEESMTGKGPDDKEFAIRLIHAGIKAYNLKFYAIAHHLYHGDEGLRNNYGDNQRWYAKTIKARRIEALKGLNQ
ncbi:glycosyltransferase family 2 protein [Carboxylicivirga mesophila]|uniref:Glycosyltransferase family 2 protein n=1 Tax=Carboxylicivirga mesophila TaxID=1166478 RepID=A0ABS5K5E6_9BACT|nr:glycosyltransferase family 2 protein [Carboxylicivirga mesophila]MBS2210224.1 glycosyltransferase family 2 protein [Carboxylicivirga mesophila]